jgi:HK97 family phage prohead protease
MNRGIETILKPTEKDHKQFHLEMKVKDTSRRLIEGFASTRFPDRANEIVAPQALLDAMKLYMRNPLVLLDHDQRAPIGKTVSYAITPDGLHVTIEIISGTEKADETWTEIQQGVRRALSIGFIPRVVDYTSNEFPSINELELLEISVVTIPCNRESLFSIAKALTLGTDLIDKLMPKIGWDKTKAQLLEMKSVIASNYAGLPTEDKIFVESILKDLQTITHSDSIESDLQAEIEKLELQFEIDAMESGLQELN